MFYRILSPQFEATTMADFGPPPCSLEQCKETEDTTSADSAKTAPTSDSPSDSPSADPPSSETGDIRTLLPGERSRASVAKLEANRRRDEKAAAEAKAAVEAAAKAKAAIDSTEAVAAKAKGISLERAQALQRTQREQREARKAYRKNLATCIQDLDSPDSPSDYDVMCKMALLECVLGGSTNYYASPMTWNPDKRGTPPPVGAPPSPLTVREALGRGAKCGNEGWGGSFLNTSMPKGKQRVSMSVVDNYGRTSSSGGAGSGKQGARRRLLHLLSQHLLKSTRRAGRAGRAGRTRRARRAGRTGHHRSHNTVYSTRQTNSKASSKASSKTTTETATETKTGTTTGPTCTVDSTCQNIDDEDGVPYGDDGRCNDKRCVRRVCTKDIHCVVSGYCPHGPSTKLAAAFTWSPRRCGPLLEHHLDHDAACHRGPQCLSQHCDQTSISGYGTKKCLPKPCTKDIDCRCELHLKLINIFHSTIQCSEMYTLKYKFLHRFR